MISDRFQCKKDSTRFFIKLKKESPMLSRTETICQMLNKNLRKSDNCFIICFGRPSRGLAQSMGKQILQREKVKHPHWKKSALKYVKALLEFIVLL